MKIGFDVDGVLTDLEKFQLEYGAKFFKQNYGMKIVNENGCSIREIFDCSKEQEYEFWKKYLVYYSIKWPMRPGASNVINKLQQDGNAIYIITSRIKTCDNDVIGFFMRYLVKSWFKNNGVEIDEKNFKFCSINNSGVEKSEFCLQENIDFMIEDDVSNISKLKSVTNVICYKTSYNSNLFDDVIKIDSFYELYNIICERYHSEKFKYLKYKERCNLDRNELIKYYKDLRNDYMKRKTMIDIKQTEKYYLSRYPIMKKVFDFKYPYEIENEELIPDEDGIIYIINHRTMLDCPLLMSAIGRKPMHLLLKAEFLENVFSRFLKSIGSVFVVRDNVDSEISSSEELTKLVLKGTNILICPEGTRNKTNDVLLSFKKGAVSIAQKTGRPIVPVAIINKESGITLKFGMKFYVDIFDDIECKNQELRQYMFDMITSNEKDKICKKLY